MSEQIRTILADATLAVWDVLADRGARSGKGYMRTSCHVVTGRRRAIADAIAPFVPEGTTPDNVNAVATVVAKRLATDETIKAKIAAGGSRPGVTADGTAPGGFIRS